MAPTNSLIWVHQQLRVGGDKVHHQSRLFCVKHDDCSKEDVSSERLFCGDSNDDKLSALVWSRCVSSTQPSDTPFGRHSGASFPHREFDGAPPPRSIDDECPMVSSCGRPRLFVLDARRRIMETVCVSCGHRWSID